MANLTANQESFIKLMAKSDEHARRGFELLLARPDFETFFDALEEMGMFKPVHNSAPVPANEPGYFRIPYAPATQPVFALLVERGVLDTALREALKGRHAREKLIERIALAYLWGDEDLDSSRFSYLFESSRIEDLAEATTFFWSVSNQELSPAQVERILSFLARCVAWSRDAVEPPAKLLSQLGRLSCYIKSVEEREQEWLLAVAPYVHVGYNADDFIEELDRLANISPAKISAVLGKVLETFVPTFDFQDKLKSLLTKLAAHGYKAEAIYYADRLRQLPGMAQLFTQLTVGS